MALEWAVEVFFWKVGLEIVHQAGFIVKGKQVIGQGWGVTKKVTEGNKSLADEEEMGYKDFFCMTEAKFGGGENKLWSK